MTVRCFPSFHQIKISKLIIDFESLITNSTRGVFFVNRTMLATLMLEFRFSCNTQFPGSFPLQAMSVWGEFFKRFYFRLNKKMFWYKVLK